MADLTLKEKLQAAGLKTVISYVDKDPDQNIPKIVDWLLKHDIGGDSLTPQVRVIKKYINDKDNNWYKLIKSLWTDCDDGIRRKLFENFIINAGMLEATEKEGINGVKVGLVSSTVHNILFKRFGG